MSKIEITFFRPFENGFGIGWEGEMGFGEFVFYEKDGRVICDNECMDRDTVREALSAFADFCEMKDGE